MSTERNLRILNVASFAGTVIMNILANALPLNGKTTGELSDACSNLFTPAGYVFSIWGVIYLLLLVFTFYQYKSKRTDEDFLERIGYLFIGSSLANIVWIFFWHYEYVELSVLAMFSLLACLIGIYLRLDVGRAEVSRDVERFVHLPFSIYLGWISVAPIANVSALLSKYGWDAFSLGEELWTAIMILVALLLTLVMIFQRGDTGYSLVIFWALGGILVKQMGVQLIMWVSALSILVISVVLVARWFNIL